MRKQITCFACLVVFAVPCLAANEFTLQDFLNRTWCNECVEFPLSRAQLKSANAGNALVARNGKPVLYQVVPAASKKDPSKIAFLADLDPFETRVYRFTNFSAKVTTDLKMEETADLIRISNDSAGISIRKKLTEGVGPIEAIRLNSGAWIGGSRLTNTDPFTAYSATVTARGPVFVEVLCRASTGTNRVWEMRCRVQANEPVVLVDETYALGGKSVFVLDLSRGFTPDHVFYRTGRGQIGKLSTWKLAQGDSYPAFLLEPWLHW